MKKTILYKYLGTNGTLETPVHLEDIYSIKLYLLEAENGYVLTDGVDTRSMVKVPANEVSKWTEVKPGRK